MRPFKIVSDGPHRIIRTGSLPGQKNHELQVPDESCVETVIELDNDRTEVPPAPPPPRDETGETKPKT